MTKIEFSEKLQLTCKKAGVAYEFDLVPGNEYVIQNQRGFTGLIIL